MSHKDVCLRFCPNLKIRTHTDLSQVGHTCVSVDDLDAACKRFEDINVSWKKRLTDGRMKNVAFILGKQFVNLAMSDPLLTDQDPDNYWIEVIQNEKLKSRANW